PVQAERRVAVRVRPERRRGLGGTPQVAERELVAPDADLALVAGLAFPIAVEDQDLAAGEGAADRDRAAAAGLRRVEAGREDALARAVEVEDAGARCAPGDRRDRLGEQHLPGEQDERERLRDLRPGGGLDAHQ